MFGAADDPYLVSTTTKCIYLKVAYPVQGVI